MVFQSAHRKFSPHCLWYSLSVCVLSCVLHFAIPWTVARCAPLSMEFSRQEYWSRLPFPTLGDLPDPGIKPRSSALAGRILYHDATWEPLLWLLWCDEKKDMHCSRHHFSSSLLIAKAHIKPWLSCAWKIEWNCLAWSHLGHKWVANGILNLS